MKKYKIMLACSTGMSTSIVVQKMQKAAKELNIDAEIFAVGTIAAKNKIKDVNIVLLGPQVRYELPTFQELCSEHKIKALAMNPLDYGMANGEKILKEAIEIINSY